MRPLRTLIHSPNQCRQDGIPIAQHLQSHNCYGNTQQSPPPPQLGVAHAAKLGWTGLARVNLAGKQPLPAKQQERPFSYRFTDKRLQEHTNMATIICSGFRVTRFCSLMK